MMESENLDRELVALKAKIVELVGQERIREIKKIVEISYQLDEQPEYKITHKIVE